MSSGRGGVVASKGAASLTATADVVTWPRREDVQSGRGHGDHVFPLRRQPAVHGDHGPAVGQHLGVALALVDHRFDGEGHALLQHQALARPAVVQHLRLVVVDLADAVAAVLAHHREALALGVLLDRVADRSEEHTSELQSLMRISYAVFCLKKKKKNKKTKIDSE